MKTWASVRAMLHGAFGFGVEGEYDEEENGEQHKERDERCPSDVTATRGDRVLGICARISAITFESRRGCCC